MLKDENGKIVFTVDDALEWLKEDIAHLKAIDEQKPEEMQDWKKFRNEGLEHAIWIIEFHKERFERKAEAEGC